eukprot:m.791053 g.791053  ORF g.791053 m.791053 type:complete len:160 (-) comp59210_c1_seq4:1696-2175(-)
MSIVIHRRAARLFHAHTFRNEMPIFKRLGIETKFKFRCLAPSNASNRISPRNTIPNKEDAKTHGIDWAANLQLGVEIFVVVIHRDSRQNLRKSNSSCSAGTGDEVFKAESKTCGGGWIKEVRDCGLPYARSLADVDLIEGDRCIRIAGGDEGLTGGSPL